jgi:hypothetical protein
VAHPESVVCRQQTTIIAGEEERRSHARRPQRGGAGGHHPPGQRLQGCVQDGGILPFQQAQLADVAAGADVEGLRLLLQLLRPVQRGSCSRQLLVSCLVGILGRSCSLSAGLGGIQQCDLLSNQRRRPALLLRLHRREDARHHAAAQARGVDAARGHLQLAHVQGSDLAAAIILVSACTQQEGGNLVGSNPVERA